MSTDRQATDIPHWPLIRVTQLWDVLNQAKDWNKLCEWLFFHARSGRRQMYWKVPEGYIVLSGAHSPFDHGLNAPTHSAASPPPPSEWSRLPNVKFVRLSSRAAQEVALQAYRQGSYIKPPVLTDRFPGGLSIPEDEHAPNSEYEALPTSIELHVASTDPSTPNTWDMMEVFGTQVFVDDSLLAEIREQLEDVQNTTSTVNPITPATASTITHPLALARRKLAIAAGKDPQVDTANTDDPYNLKNHSNGVYMLYRMAERCALNPAFVRACMAKDKGEANTKAAERTKIALEMFNQLLSEMAKSSDEENQLQRELQRFFGKTRLNGAIHLIDPHFDHNDGKSEHDRQDWPNAKGKDFLAQPDPRRKPFVTDMLRLIIGGAEQWLSFKTAHPDNSSTKQEALRQWLEEYGLTRAGELRTAFTVIAWNGNSVPQLPKSA